MIAFKQIKVGPDIGVYEVLPLIEAINKSSVERMEIIGIFDDNPRLKNAKGHQVIGPISS